MTRAELTKQRHTLLENMRSLLDKAKSENRSLTEEEQAAFADMKRQVATIEASLELDDMRSKGQQAYALTSRRHALAEAIRSLVTKKEAMVDVAFRAADTTITTTGVEPVTPVTINEIIEPLEQGLILGLLGLKLKTGLKGEQKWPTVAAVEASFAEEAVAIDDTKISLDKLVPQPKRVAISVPISNAAIDQSDDVILDEFVLPQITASVQRILNKAMFSTTKINTLATEGCFVNPGTKVTFAGAVPTYAELQSLRGKVRAKGIIADGTFAYVMSSEMAAALRATAKDAGSGKFIIEDDKIDGIPVFETEYIEAANTTYATKGPKYVGFGRFSDFLIGQFGNTRLTVDNLTGAASDVTKVVLNTYFAYQALRPEAFGLGTATIA